ncbi:hypothetical protein TNIN_101361 [Trichonephila inaurata madagascariensis]|uniref:Uncharacterized protein n=1 Tax=Trichonephila inaurata madagascariensis TaxID=2747483 RepID=A0A8X6X738_9ARAC|nr:hypothetical protein TNIN_101361 [Trichonephila inaurata madagascariensis]
MVVGFILETSLCLISCVLSECILGHALSFFGIVCHILILKLVKTLITSCLGNIDPSERINLIVEADKQQTGDPIVHSWMIYKMCEALDLKAKFVAVPHRITWVSKRKKKAKPVVYSKTILKLCEALDLDAQLSTSTGREQPQPNIKHQSGCTKSVPVVQSFTIFKMCEVLGLDAKLKTEM